VVNKINLLHKPLLRYQYFNDSIKNKKWHFFDFEITTCKTTRKRQKEGQFTTPVPVEPFFVAGCIVAARGFVYLGIPLGNILLPVGEMIIFFVFIFISHTKSMPNFFEEGVSWWLLAWLVYGIARIFIAMPDVEFITLKTSCMIYYCLFVYFGFLVARRREAVDQFFKILGISFLLLFFHFVFYSRPIGNFGLSPKLYQGINLLGSFGSPYFHTIGGCFFFIIISKSEITVNSNLSI